MEAEVGLFGSGILPLILNRSAENRQVLQHIGATVRHDVPPDLAMTDPARYRKLTRLRSELILRGCFGVFAPAGSEFP